MRFSSADIAKDSGENTMSNDRHTESPLWTPDSLTASNKPSPSTPGSSTCSATNPGPGCTDLDDVNDPVLRNKVKEMLEVVSSCTISQAVQLIHACGGSVEDAIFLYIDNPPQQPRPTKRVVNAEGRYPGGIIPGIKICLRSRQKSNGKINVGLGISAKGSQIVRDTLFDNILPTEEDSRVIQNEENDTDDDIQYIGSRQINDNQAQTLNEIFESATLEECKEALSLSNGDGNLAYKTLRLRFGSHQARWKPS